MSLRTDYKDDVFTGNRKYNMIQNGDGTVSFTDVTEYTQEGDTYGAAQINDANAYINNLENKAYKDSDTAETTLANEDYVPFYDASASAKRKTLWSNLVNTLKNSLAIKVHDSTSAGTYGAATSTKYGHAKLSNNYTSSAGSADQSVGASSQAVYDAYRNRAPINHAVAQTTYGIGTGSLFGHLKISDSYATSSGTAAEGMAASGKAVNDAYTALGSRIGTAESSISSLTTRVGNDETAINGKAPTNHAVNANTYGLGTSGLFGHVKPSNTYASAVGYADTGIVASQGALYDVYHKTYSVQSGNASYNTDHIRQGGYFSCAWRRVGNIVYLNLSDMFLTNRTQDFINGGTLFYDLPQAAVGTSWVITLDTPDTHQIIGQIMVVVSGTKVISNWNYGQWGSVNPDAYGNTDPRIHNQTLIYPCIT